MSVLVPASAARHAALARGRSRLPCVSSSGQGPRTSFGAWLRFYEPPVRVWHGWF